MTDNVANSYRVQSIAPSVHTGGCKYVVVDQHGNHLSYHQTPSAARAAIARYEASDARRRGQS